MHMVSGTRTVLAASFLLAGCTRTSHTLPKKTAVVEDDSTSRFGIAIRSSGHVCVSIMNTNLPPDAPVKLVSPEKPQSAAEAVAIGRTPNCPAGPDDANSTSYDLRIVKGSVEDNVENIAVTGPATLSAGNDNTVAGRLDPGANMVMFRSCASSEGLHLTVWSGEPLKSVRLWHAYHHLDYDVEPTCTAQDTNQ